MRYFLKIVFIFLLTASILLTHIYIPNGQTNIANAYTSITDSTDLSQRAVWWNTSWRYRTMITVTAPATVLYDKQVSTTINWTSIFSSLGISSSTLDTASLRLVEYTSGGHIQYRQTNDVNRFETIPLYLSGSGNTTLEFILPGQTSASETRYFMLYFDTTDNSKSSKDYHYMTTATGATYEDSYREGPDTENVIPSTNTQTGFHAQTNSGGNDSLTQLISGESSSYYMYYPFHYKVTGDSTTNRGFQSATYTKTSTPVYIQLSPTFTGYNGANGIETSGTGTIKVTSLIAGMTVNGSTVAQNFAVAQGNLTITILPNASAGTTISTASIPPRIAVLSSGAGVNLWYTDSNCSIATSPTSNTSYAFGASCTKPIFMKNTGASGNHTQVFQLDTLSYTSTSFNYTNNIKFLWDGNTRAYLHYGSATNTWHKGDSITYAFTYIQANKQYTYSEMQPIIDSINATVTTSIGNSATYSTDLLKGQFYYYEGKAWDYVQYTLMPNGWGKSWNITYGHDIVNDTYQQAHDNDSSMGAGFILYAASIKAAMTGESRYYTIADAYANYFLELEAEDIREHSTFPGDGRANTGGRITYGYNGGDTQISFNNTCGSGGIYGAAPAHSEPNCSSNEQMLTSAMGLWAYHNLDSTKVNHHGEVHNLLIRMANFHAVGDTNVVANGRLGNLKIMMGESSGAFSGTQSNYTSSSYFTPCLSHTNSEINTGAQANNFFVDGFDDKILPTKTASKLTARYTYVANDTGTATKYSSYFPYYTMTRTTNYTASWGYVFGEFPAIGMLKSMTGTSLKCPSSASPQQDLTVTAGGGVRDGLSGRITEHAAVIAWGALHDSTAKIQVINSSGAQTDGPLYSDWLQNALITINGILMHDNGGIRDAMYNTLGNSSGLSPNVLMSDFSGYYLLTMAYYHMLDKTVSKPTPINALDYINTVREDGYTTTIQYLGSNNSITQTIAFPVTNRPIFASGLFSNPTFTAGTNGEITELSSGTYNFTANLNASALQTATIAQVPITISTSNSTVNVTVVDYRAQNVTWTMSSSSEPTVTITTIDMPPNTSIALTIDGKVAATSKSNSSGTATFTYSGGFSSHTFKVAPVSDTTTVTTSSKNCTDIKPGTPPQLYAAIAQGKSSILLYFTDSMGFYDHYALEYGTKPDTYIYGASSIGDKGTRTYLVEQLQPNTTYYFRVRAVNGCSSGEWSNEIFTKTLGTTTYTTNTSNSYIVKSELTPGDVDISQSDKNTCSYDVQSGDSLWSIADKKLGDGSKYKDIIEENKEAYPSLQNSNSLEKGWKLKMNCKEEKKEEKVSEKTYDLNVKVVDTTNKPVENADVELHSIVRTAKTDAKGIATFKQVEEGEHKVKISYAGNSGEQKLTLNGDVKEFNLNLQVKAVNPFTTLPVISVIAVLLLIILGLSIKLIVNARKKAIA